VTITQTHRPSLLLLVLAIGGALTTGGRVDPGGGSLIAVFAMKSTLLLCSDGRIVRASDGQVLREDYRKVHKLTNRAGLLTAGRELPGLLTAVSGDVARRPDAAFDEVVAMTRTALVKEWRALPPGQNGAPSGRVFAYIAGFDQQNQPRLVELDSAATPMFRADAVPLLDRGQELDVAAIATTRGPNEDVSAVIVRHVDVLARSQPAIDRTRLLLSAFEASKAELSLRNPRIGGATFSAAITQDAGYRDLSGR
jgi:hypothetical protein